MEKRLTERVQVRISKESHDKLVAEAKERGIKVPNLLRWIIGEWYRPKPKVDPSRPMRGV